MSAPDFSLLAKRRYGPLFVVQFLGAFNDNVLKFALLFLANFSIYVNAPEKAEMLATLATGIFILPYFFLSSIAGQLADMVDKSRLIRWVKGAEILIMGIGLYGLAAESVPVLLGALFLMGVHSTIFGPVKYSIIPQHLGAQEIMGGTGLIEAGTFVAILGGQLLAGLIVPWEAGLVAMGLAVVGFIASLFIPLAPPESTGKIDWNIAKGTWEIMKDASKGRGVWLAILGIAWFFAAGAVLVSEFAPLASGVMNADQSVVTLFLIVFSISVAIGSLFVNRLLKGEVSARFVPVSALMMAAFLIDLWLSTSGFHVREAGANIATFLRTPGAIHVLIGLAGVAFSGGMFVVPLYAIVQVYAPKGERSRVLAAANVVNAGVTVLVVLATLGLLAIGVEVPGIIGTLGFATLFVALVSCYLLPETVIKGLFRSLLTLLYRVEVKGGENMPQPGERAVVVVNHVSWLDGLLLAVFLPGKPTFAIASSVAKMWWVKPALKLFEAFPVDPTNPMSTKAMVRTVKEGRTLVIFPEGRITVTGALMKIFDGPGMVADKADAPIVPVRIDGAQYSTFSKLRGKVRTRWFPKITLTILPPQRFGIEGEMTARARRAIAGRRLHEEMSKMIFATSSIDRTLFEALIDAKDLNGGNAQAVEDVKRVPLTYKKLVIGSLALGRELNAVTRQGEAVGLLLPNVNGVVAAFFALQSGGRVPAMLNYTAGAANLKAACLAADISTIVTARAFVEQGKLGDVIAALEADGRRIVWLEDVATRIGTRREAARAFRGKFRIAQPPRAQDRARCARRHPVYKWLRRPAQGRRSHPSQSARQLRATVRADRFQFERRRAQCIAGVPQLRADRWHAAADPRRGEDAALSEPAPLPDRPRTRL